MTEATKNYDEQKFRAKRWGLKHGYFGMKGGWIYRDDIRFPICHGWARLYKRNRTQIDRWTSAHVPCRQSLVCKLTDGSVLRANSIAAMFKMIYQRHGKVYTERDLAGEPMQRYHLGETLYTIKGDILGSIEREE